MRRLVLLALLCVFWGCKKEDETVRATGTAKVQLVNNTDELSLAENEGIPDKLEIVFLNVSLAEDFDEESASNVGKGSFIYINPDCRKSEEELVEEQAAAGEGKTIGQDDVDHCGTEAGTTSKGIVIEKIADTAIDLSLGTKRVNKILNSQNRVVDVGDAAKGEEGDTTATYRYAGIQFQFSHEKAKTTNWSFEETGVEDETFRYLTGEIRVKLEEPLVVHGGDLVMVNLEYDLAGTVVYGSDVDTDAKDPDMGTYQPGKADDCVGEIGDADYTCVTMPDFSVSFEIVE